MIRLEYCDIEWTELGARVVFPDGAETCAHPHPEEPHYHVIAHRCGYGDDLLAYCREHELAHAIVAQEFRGWVSWALHAQAHGYTPTAFSSTYEEIVAQTLQRWARANERPIVGGVDWDAIKDKFLGAAILLDKERLEAS